MWEREYPNRNWDFVLEISIKCMLNARTPVSAERTERIEVKGDTVYEEKKSLKFHSATTETSLIRWFQYKHFKKKYIKISSVNTKNWSTQMAIRLSSTCIRLNTYTHTHRAQINRQTMPFRNWLHFIEPAGNKHTLSHIVFVCNG